MIEPKDLRIGNTIYDRHGNVSHIHAGWFYITQDPKRLEDYSPIKLTPKILEGCGFYKGVDKMYRLNHVYKIKYTNTKIMSNCVEFYKNAGRNYTFISALNYLHQLQNLCYSLTGSELKVVW